MRDYSNEIIITLHSLTRHPLPPIHCNPTSWTIPIENMLSQVDKDNSLLRSLLAKSVLTDILNKLPEYVRYRCTRCHVDLFQYDEKQGFYGEIMHDFCEKRQTPTTGNILIHRAPHRHMPLPRLFTYRKIFLQLHQWVKPTPLRHSIFLHNQG